MTTGKVIKGYYGTGTQCNILVCGLWYCVEGSRNVNKTLDEITQGTNVETLRDIHMFEYSTSIYTIEDLIDAIYD